MIEKNIKDRIEEINKRLGRRIRVAHVTPAGISLDILLASRIGRLRELGVENIGISGDLECFEKGDLGGGVKRVHLKYLTREMKPIEDLKSICELVGVFHRIEPDVVATYGPKPGIFGRIAARFASVPVVVHTNWGLYFSENSSPIRKSTVIALETIAAQFGDYVLSVNREDMRILSAIERLSIGRKKGNVTYLGNACDLKYFDIKEVEEYEIAIKKMNWGVDEKKTIVGMVGRLVREKGCVEFIEAAEKIKKENGNCEFVLVGPSDKKKKDAVDIEKVKGKVVVAGYEKQMRVAYAAMDIVVLPSYREGFPRSLVEACAMGRPIVATDIRGCREAVENEGNGFLVPVKNVKELAKSIEFLVDNEEIRIEMGKRSREIAEERFDEEALVSRMLKIYLDGISERLNCKKT